LVDSNHHHNCSSNLGTYGSFWNFSGTPQIHSGKGFEAKSSKFQKKMYKNTDFRLGFWTYLTYYIKHYFFLELWNYIYIYYL
ncbi:MAG: hypothetical protein RBT40_03885, partial [Petrimonas sp.]|nr:hypothetical protein [Petrimonas sp.]